jgi:hypothetical protein
VVAATKLDAGAALVVNVPVSAGWTPQRATIAMTTGGTTVVRRSDSGPGGSALSVVTSVSAARRRRVCRCVPSRIFSSGGPNGSMSNGR